MNSINNQDHLFKKNSLFKKTTHISTLKNFYLQVLTGQPGQQQQWRPQKSYGSQFIFSCDLLVLVDSH